MDREDKRRNKKNCKDAQLSVKLQCWYFRNKTEIKTIVLSAITSILTHLIIICLLILLALALGADVSNLI